MVVLFAQRVFSPIVLIFTAVAFLLLNTAFANAQTQRVSILGIEVTQGIQSMGEGNPRDQSQDNLVNLIKNRKTLIRVYFSKKGAYRAKLNVTNFEDQEGEWLESALNQHITVSGLKKRTNLNSSLNFEIPTHLLKGNNITVRSISIVDASSNPHSGFACNNCSTYPPLSLPLKDSAPLRLRLIGMSYSVENKTYTPTEQQFKDTLSWLQRTYPISEILLTPQRPTDEPIYETMAYEGNLFDPSRNDPIDPQHQLQVCQRANMALAQRRKDDLSKETNENVRKDLMLTRYVAMLSDTGFPKKAKKKQFFVGCAQELRNSSDVVATAPVGTTEKNWFSWDQDGYYGDWQVAHELAHTLELFHPTSKRCPTSDYPEKRETRISPPRPSSPQYLGLDFGAPGKPRKTIPGHWDDLMAYCPKREVTRKDESKWISPYSYKNLYDQLNVKVTTSANMETGHFVTALASINLSRKQGFLIYVREAARTSISQQEEQPSSQARVKLRITQRTHGQGEQEQIVTTERPLRLHNYPGATSKRNGIGTVNIDVPVSGEFGNITKVELLIDETIVATKEAIQTIRLLSK